ncbi:nucleic acid-binding, OB-fold protein [Artemisia annua]|uniref:Nucleic acid-binding, OB-fold protein n=1 Tax=Artemisia annua TaxID=35608 RepID=A0A2U1PLJ6_ARTAN|nr:nucleic acid-binding, OB-fold protein [Artemisia annua]
MTEAIIKDLNPTSRNRILEAKVYRSWIGRNPPDITERSYHAILLDRQGDAIQANMEVSEKKQFTTYLIPGRTYRISGFTCAPTSNWQQTLENRTSLSFTRFTKFDAIPPMGFPNHYFRFISYNRLPYRVVDPEDKTRKVRNSVELTLWDDLAESFPKEKIDALEKPIIIAVSSCRVGRFRNNLQLSSTPATYYYINPDIPELPQYRAEYKAAFDLNPPLQVVRHPYQDKEREKMRNRIPFSKLLTENPLTHTVHRTIDFNLLCLEKKKDVRFTCEGTITDTITMTFFPPKADDIVGVKCETFVNSLQNPDPRQFPERILALIGKKHIFQFHYNTNSRQGPVTFILHEILDKPDTQTHIKDNPSESLPAPTQLPSPISEVPIAEADLPSTIMSTDQTPQTLESQEENPLQEEDNSGVELPPIPPAYTYMQTRSRHEKQVAAQVAGGATPPPTQEDFTKTSTKASVPESNKPTTAKRQLFQEKQGYGKKNKKE